MSGENSINDAILRGSIDNLPLKRPNIIRVFLSCTFSGNIA